MKTLVLLLLLANLSLFAYTRLDSMGSGEGARLAQQVQADKIHLLSSQQVAALGPAKAASLADVCVEWGPFTDADRTRALSTLEPLDLGRLMSQKRVEVIANYWVYLPPLASKALADQRAAELRGKGIKDVVVLDAGPQRLAISLGVFRTEDAAKARQDALIAQGVAAAKAAPRAQSVQETALVVRDPPAAAMSRIRELLPDYPGTDLKTGPCDRAA